MSSIQPGGFEGTVGHPNAGTGQVVVQVGLKLREWVWAGERQSEIITAIVKESREMCACSGGAGEEEESKNEVSPRRI